MSSIRDDVLPDVRPLSAAQRQRVRDLLEKTWRDHVETLTHLSVRFHTHDEHSPARERIDARLSVLRRSLVEIELALSRLRSGTYGRCDGCETRIPFELLERAPHERWCQRCRPAQPHAGAPA